jgi:hypothetical protein
MPRKHYKPEEIVAFTITPTIHAPKRTTSLARASLKWSDASGACLRSKAN